MIATQRDIELHGWVTKRYDLHGHIVGLWWEGDTITKEYPHYIMWNGQFFDTSFIPSEERDRIFITEEEPYVAIVRPNA